MTCPHCGKQDDLVYIGFMDRHLTKEEAESELSLRIEKLDALSERIDFSRNFRDINRANWDRVMKEATQIEIALGL